MTETTNGQGIVSPEVLRPRILPFPDEMTFNDRLWAVHDLFDLIGKALDVCWDRKTELLGLPSDPKKSGLRHSFGHVLLDEVDSPSTLVIDDGGWLLMGPRLEFHLDSGAPRRETLDQLPQIARFISERGLAERYPDIVATTYLELLRTASRLTGMRHAVMTSYSPKGDRIRSGIKLSYDEYCERNNRDGATFRALSITIPTDEFVQRWAPK